MENCFLVKLKDRGFLAWSIQLHTGYYVTNNVEKARKYVSVKDALDNMGEFEEWTEEKLDRRSVAILMKEGEKLYRVTPYGSN
jgi:hypothetical protein